jgi:hypothetical protein
MKNIQVKNIKYRGIKKFKDIKLKIPALYGYTWPYPYQTAIE